MELVTLIYKKNNYMLKYLGKGVYYESNQP